MSRSSKSELLASLPLFRACTTKELKQIEALVDQVSVEAGHVLTRQGAAGTEAFVIVKGEAKVEVDDAVVANVGMGEMVGEMVVPKHNATAYCLDTPNGRYGKEYARLLELTRPA